THVVSTTSNSDVNGNLQVVQREVADTKKTSPDAQETSTTVYNSDGSGGLTPSLETKESRKNTADHTVEVKKTTLLPDGNGNWGVGEVTENTIKENGKNRTSDERVSVPNSDGGLSESSRTVSKDTENAAGETTEQQIEQTNPENPDAGLQVNAKTKYTVHYAASGTQEL